MIISDTSNIDDVTDHDNDGATALMEYCWPFTLDSCLDSEKTKFFNWQVSF